MKTMLKKKNYFNFDHLKKHLNKNYFIIKITPSFYKDFLWYKKFNEIEHNKNIFNQVDENEINFIDFETRFNVKDKKAHQIIKKINNMVSNFSYDKKINLFKINLLKTELSKLSNNLNYLKKNNKISKGIDEFIYWIELFKKGKNIPRKSTNFYKLHGIQTSCVTILKS